MISPRLCLSASVVLVCLLLLSWARPVEMTRMKNKKKGELVLLDDSSFESLTQAATGATTGDWMVLFYGEGCEEEQKCKDVLEVMGPLASSLKGEANVAQLKMDVNPKTKLRFHGLKVPSLFFFHKGVMLGAPFKADVAALQKFVGGGFKSSRQASYVPPEVGSFDLFMAEKMGVEEYRDLQRQLGPNGMTYIVLGLGCGLGLLVKRLMGKKKVEKEE